MKSISTHHRDMIHDAQLDYYGKRLATCSSDRTVRIFDVIGDEYEFVQELRGHEGPVWQCAWSHPQFGNLLATCSYDRQVIIWKETSPRKWERAFTYTHHESSVNSVSFAPHELGCILASGSSDGFIGIISLQPNGNWEHQKYLAHQMGCNTVSWCSGIREASLISPDVQLVSEGGAPLKFLASGGCDGRVKVWTCRADNTWECLKENELEGHGGWVRDIAWAQGIGLPGVTIASCSQDQTVLIWRKDEKSKGWTKKELPKFNDVVWRVSWSMLGTILAVSSGDNKVSLWKEVTDGNWECVQKIEDKAIPINK